MNEIHSSLYPRFRCIGPACRHNCCIGWEIDIDPDTLSRYLAAPGDLGERLRRDIDRNDTPHFHLGADGRCPFLNTENLCDIQLAEGETALSQICRDHPRFRTFLPGRTEIGLGLCCEEAARLLLSEKDPILLSGRKADALPAETETLLRQREKLLAAAQDRSLSLGGRMRKILALAGSAPVRRSRKDWTGFLLSLEALEPEWAAAVARLRDEKPDYDAFRRHMVGRETEYENLLFYFIFRHYLAECGKNAAARAAFAVWCVGMLYALGAAIFTENGEFSFSDQVELVRLWSENVEYSEENMNAVLLQISPK